ncbi:MAG TPA: SDR family oxidoreductase [Caulobacteraceae bacterium]|jgi:nucleoside-diphosphate-sugar epimerase
MAKALRLFLFGPGYSALALARRMQGRGWSVCGTARSAENGARLTALGIESVNLADAATLDCELRRSQAVLVSAPPGEHGCPALAALEPILERSARLDWIGYLSTTGVYGDRGGRWVREDSPIAPQSLQGHRRVEAEAGWLHITCALALNLAIFRLPGIYGPGRSALDRLRDGSARRVVKPGQVFSRIHVQDLASALEASIARARPGAIYNLCDDQPCPPQDVIAYAAALLGVEPPQETPFAEAQVSPASRRFFGESKRVSNALAKAELGWRPAYPSYREGLAAILAAEAAT